jgi:hypothetical protein
MSQGTFRVGDAVVTVNDDLTVECDKPGMTEILAFQAELIMQDYSPARGEPRTYLLRQLAARYDVASPDDNFEYPDEPGDSVIY